MQNFTGNVYQNALIEGYRLGNPVIDYYLSGSGTGGAWTNIEAAAFAGAAGSWSAVANISFQRVFAQSQADFIETKFISSSQGSLGSHGIFNGSTTNTIDTITIGGFVQPLTGRFNENGFGWDENDPNGGLVKGGLGYSTIIHELGHGLGLNHTHREGLSDPQFFPGATTEQSAGDNALNDEIFSVMSYRSGPMIRPNFIGETQSWGKIGTPMAFDIAAIQALYGANMTTATGNDVYTLPVGEGIGVFWSAIWDAGGTDTIIHYGNTSATIDLRPATLQNEVGGGGFVSAADNTFGGFTIAANVVIENATGGTAGDRLTGNDVANTLNGFGGNDVLVGGGGDDVLIGGNGSDQLYGGSGNDRLVLDSTDSVMNGGAGNDAAFLAVTGNYNANGTGIETWVGSAGNDLIENTGSASYFVFGLNGNDTLRGSSNADLLIGGNGTDTLIGNGGKDLLNGSQGSDVLNGGAGNDLLLGGAGATDFFQFSGGSGGDQILDWEDGLDRIDFRANAQVNSIDDVTIAQSGNTAFVFYQGTTDYAVIYGGFANGARVDADDMMFA